MTGVSRSPSSYVQSTDYDCGLYACVTALRCLYGYNVEQLHTATERAQIASRLLKTLEGGAPRAYQCAESADPGPLGAGERSTQMANKNTRTPVGGQGVKEMDIPPPQLGVIAELDIDTEVCTLLPLSTLNLDIRTSLLLALNTVSEKRATLSHLLSLVTRLRAVTGRPSSTCTRQAALRILRKARNFVLTDAEAEQWTLSPHESLPENANNLSWISQSFATLTFQSEMKYCILPCRASYD